MSSSLRRKHMDLRRQGSFHRLQRIPELVDIWFRTNESLHSAIEAFAQAHCHESPAFAVQTTKGCEGDSQVHAMPALACSADSNLSDGLELDHHAFSLLKRFVSETVDAHLALFREEHRLSESEFEAVIQLSVDEESESKHFFRWTEVSSMPAFLVLMRAAYNAYKADGNEVDVRGKDVSEGSNCRPAVNELLHFLESLSLDARNHHRKKTRLRPFLNKWCPDTFNSILDLIAASATEFPPNLDTACRKNLARWRLKLTSSSVGPSGEQSRNEEEWLLYLERYCEAMSDATFESFMAFGEAFLSGRPEEGEELKDRRASWLCFQQLDPLHTATVYLEDLLEELAGFEQLFTNDAQRAIVFRKLRLKLDAEDKNNRLGRSVVGGEQVGQTPLVAQALAKVESIRTATSEPKDEAGSSVSCQSAQAGDRSKSLSQPSDAAANVAHHHSKTLLLNMNQFHKALDYVYRNCRNPEFRQTVCRTFRTFVIALHKLIAQHDGITSLVE